MAYSPKDLFNLQEDVVNGKLKMENLPTQTVSALQDYWDKNPASYADDPMMTDQESNRIKALAEQRSASASGDLPFFLKPIEWVGSKLYWLYSHSISPLASMAAMGVHNVVYGQDSSFDGNHSWQDAWDAARDISPGQAVWMLGLNNNDLKKRGISPQQITQDSKLALAGKYHDTPTKADPFGIKTPKEEYFGQGFAKYATGAADLAVSWYADPLVLTGKAAGATRTATFVKPVKGIVAKAGGDFTEVEKTPTFTKMVDTVMKYKTLDNDTAPLRLRRDMPTLSRSANGDLLARLLGKAKDEDEVSQVLRISMGDYHGYLGLESKNADLANQAQSSLTRLTALDQRFHGLSPTAQASPAGLRIKGFLDNEAKRIGKLNAETRFIDQKMDAFRSLDNLHFNQLTTPVGMKWRGSDLAQGKTMSVRGQPIIKAAPALVYNSTIGYPIKVIRAYNDIKPTYHIDVHGENSYLDLQESLKEVKSISRDERDKYVSSYIKATPNERGQSLLVMESDITQKLAAKYGVSPDVARDLYDDFATRRKSGQQGATARTYGSATMPDPANPGMTIRVAEVESNGGRLVSTPIFDTQLANNHVIMDFGHFENLLKNHGKRFESLKNNWGIKGQKWTDASHVADVLNSYWKFAQLFRLGYAPRALSDDFLGQVARFGATAMVARAGRGTANIASRFVRGRWAASEVAANQARMDVLETHITEQGARQSQLKLDLSSARAKGASTSTIEDDLRDAAVELRASQFEHHELSNATNKTNEKDVKVGRQVFAAPFGGQQGKLFEDLSSGKRNLSNLLGREADAYTRGLRRLDWENITPGTHGIVKHSGAWERLINDQIGKSSIGREALTGKSEAQLVHWMRSDPKGIQYRHDIGLKNISDSELAQRVKAQVDYILDPAIPGMDAIRASALQGKLDMSVLENAVPVANRPMVNAETFKYATGTSSVSALLDRGISGFYNLANQLPAQKLLRNPLFAQTYAGHLKDGMKILRRQGVTHVDDSLRLRLESNARSRALADVKAFTFNMDHETKMAHHLRNFGAFFGAQQESWNRWGRIIADKPQTLPHIAQVYGAPSRVGMITDQDGNPVNGEGYSTDPLTGEKKLVKYGNRKLLFQIPEHLGGKQLNKFLGLDENAKFAIPMSSVEIILNHGDGALPVGAGPYVQMAVNHYAKESPDVADWAQKLGVLPFGPQDSVMDFINPNTGKRLGDSTDDMGETRQRALLNMMQVENWKYENGLRDKPPTWKELDDRAHKWSIFRAAMAWSLPLSVNAQDPYQFFRDEYSRMQKIDPAKADEAFYDKYGDSFYSFTASLSKNNTGLRPTKEGVQMSKYYRDLVDKVGPEYASIIVGDEGDGEFSQGAYFYQKTHAAAPGSSVTQRSTLSAREAWAQNKKALGWQQYGQLMDDVNAQLFDRGLSTVDDSGAEDLKAMRKGIVQALSEQYLPDGSDNPYYNEAWDKEFNSFDKKKYDRTAFDLQKVVDDPELWSKAYDQSSRTVGIRSDIFTLRSYLEQRKNMNLALAQRFANGGSSDITANSNADLLQSFTQFTMGLIEADTKFGRLHSRWFATDMGFNSSAIEQQTGRTQSIRDQSQYGTQTLTGSPASMQSGQDLGVDLFG